MPEGHSVHRLARQFQDVFGGARLALSSPQGRFAAGAAALDGHTLERAQAHGKQLFLHFSHDLVLRVHLGLYGAWDFGGDDTFAGASSIGAPRRIGERELPGASGRSAGTAGGALVGGAGESDDDGGPAAVYTGPPEPKGAVRVRLVSDHGWADLRGPTACEVLTPAEVATVLAKLGPDPLHNAPGDMAEFRRRITGSGTNIALQLMKQEVLAGVGNVYRAETLFRQGLDPWLPGKSLTAQEADALWLDIVSIMADGVRDGRIITTDPKHRPGSAPTGSASTAPATGPANGTDAVVPVPVADAHYVYHRTGLPCRLCGTPIALTDLGARKLYWCPTCQPR